MGINRKFIITVIVERTIGGSKNMYKELQFDNGERISSCVWFMWFKKQRRLHSYVNHVFWWFSKVLKSNSRALIARRGNARSRFLSRAIITVQYLILLFPLARILQENFIVVCRWQKKFMCIQIASRVKILANLTFPTIIIYFLHICSHLYMYTTAKCNGGIHEDRMNNFWMQLER